MSQGIKVEEITNEGQRCELGEGPHWDPKTKSLYYVDIFSPAIFRYNTKNGEIYKAKIKDNDEPIGFIIPIEDRDDEFVVGAGKDATVIRWDGRSGYAHVVRVLGEVDKFKSANRINDGKCDPLGRLFFGTMGDESTDLKSNPTGSFYRFSVEKGAENLKSSIGISNGLTWNENLGKFYYIDSITQDVKIFDYDASTGNISKFI
jgi:pyruvate kinase